MVVANILAPVLDKLLKAGLTELVAPAGALVLSGILRDHDAGRSCKDYVFGYPKGRVGHG